jgi:hypothetical protein
MSWKKCENKGHFREFNLLPESALHDHIPELYAGSVQSIQVIDAGWVDDPSIVQQAISEFAQTIDPKLLNNLQTSTSAENAAKSMEADGSLPSLVVCDPPWHMLPNCPYDVAKGGPKGGLELKALLDKKLKVIYLIFDKTRSFTLCFCYGMEPSGPMGYFSLSLICRTRTK